MVQKTRDAVVEVANLTGVNLSVKPASRDQVNTNKSFDAKSVAGGIATSVQQTSAQLKDIGDIKVALTQTLVGGGGQGPSQVMPEAGRGGLLSALMGVGGQVVGSMVGGPGGAALNMGSAVTGAVRFAAAETPGLPQHAALTPTTTSFPMYGTAGLNSNKEGGTSKPVEADYASDSVRSVDPMSMEAQKLQVMVANFSDPGNTRHNQRLMNGAGEVVAQMGEKEVVKQLGGVQAQEDKILAERRAALDHGEKVFGVQAPAEMTAERPLLKIPAAAPGSMV